MSSEAGLIRSQNISTSDVALAYRDERSPARVQPVGQRLFARDVRIERVGVAARNDSVKNPPDLFRILGGRGSDDGRLAISNVIHERSDHSAQFILSRQTRAAKD